MLTTTNNTNPNKRPRSRLMMMTTTTAPFKSKESFHASGIIINGTSQVTPMTPANNRSTPPKRICLISSGDLQKEHRFRDAAAAAASEERLRSLEKRKVSLVVITMVNLIEECPHDHRFVLSRIMLNFLKARNPALKCLCPSPTNQLLPWSERVCVRSAFRRPDDASHPQDMIFFAQWIPNFVVSVCCQGGLLIRMALMQQRLQDMELCVANLKRRCLCVDDLKSTNRTWSQPMADWMVWAAGDRMVPSGCKEQDIGPKAPWERIFTFAHRYPTRFVNGSTTSSLRRPVVFNELNPLWYLLLKNHGYVTGAPHPYLAPWTVDTACLPGMQILKPDSVGAMNTSLAVQLTTSVNLSPVMFVTMIMRLAKLCECKVNAMRGSLSHRSPIVAELHKAGFQGPLIRAAQEWCHKAIQVKHNEVAAILAMDMPGLIYPS